MRQFLAVSGSVLAAALTACGTDSSDSVMLRLNLATQRGAAVATLMQPVTQTDGVNILVIESVQMVMREIELEREDDDACDDGDNGGSDDGEMANAPGVRASSLSDDDDDGCEEFETGPILFDLPLGPGVEQTIAVEVPAGVYDELEFEIHKPEDDGDPVDEAFLAQHPDFRDISIKVTGTWNGTPFTYTSDLNEEQEHDLIPALAVEAVQTVDLTFFVDVETWFLGAGGLLIDPATANEGGANEATVENNIERSIDIFEDGNHDGHDDHGDDDDDDNSGPGGGELQR